MHNLELLERARYAAQRKDVELSIPIPAAFEVLSLATIAIIKEKQEMLLEGR
jgi:hypothetical protein